MPRESAVSAILEKAKDFEDQLHKFLGEDYNGISPDRAPYPDTRSLIGRSGEFLLYRLTESPLYATLLSSIEQITMIAHDVFADTPGKAAFEWIRQAVNWIQSLRTAVAVNSYAAGAGVDRLVVSESDARKIFDNGRCFFLKVPDDLRKTLSNHRIFLSTNRVDEKIRVVFKKGGADHSVGGTAIRWCPFLFDSLREDISSLEIWKSQVEKVLSEFQSFAKENGNADGSFGDDQEVLTQLYGFQEEISLLVEEAIESLVISPPKEPFENLNALRSHLDEIVSKKAEGGLLERAKKRKFEDHTTLLIDRFNLLDSLMKRIVFFEKYDTADPPLVRSVSNVEWTYRETCRSCLEKALLRTMDMIGLEQPAAGSPVLALCSTKAWEIEFEMYSRFQVSSQTDGLSLEYKSKARTLRWVLEACVNPATCIQIVLGDIEVSYLVLMSDLQLVPESLPSVDWRKAEDGNDGFRPHVASENVEEEPKREGDALIATNVVFKKEKKYPVHNTLIKTANSCIIKLADPADKARNIASRSVAIPKHSAQELASSISPTRKCKIKDSASRPDAPPSLAVSLAKPGDKRNHSSSKAATIQATKKARCLLNSAGMDLFTIAVSKPFIKFKARFYIECDQHASFNSYLREGLTEKGRLRIEEFSKFLSGKLKGGRWISMALRMSALSDEDAKKHRRFYKEYESAKRIAMFSVSEDSKLFLITPKFHKIAAKASGHSFKVETSTYMIVLTREPLLIAS